MCLENEDMGWGLGEVGIAKVIKRPVPETPWKCHFRDSKFQNVPRRLGPQELVPLARVPKPPTIHYQPTASKRFDSPNSMLLYGTKTTLKLNVLRRRSLVIRVRKLSESGSI